MEELKVTPETIRGVAEAKVRYWKEQVANEEQTLLAVFDYAFLRRYKRSHRQLLAAEAHLENLPKSVGSSVADRVILPCVSRTYPGKGGAK